MAGIETAKQPTHSTTYSQPVVEVQTKPGA